MNLISLWLKLYNLIVYTCVKNNPVYDTISVKCKYLCIYVANFDMDTDILRAILSNCDNTENVVQFENYKNVSRETMLYPQSDAVFDTLCTSLSNLLCYKVSKEAYQRYSIRILIIDILRKWCRITSNFQHLHIFVSKENNLKFTSNLLDKYLTDDMLNNCYSDHVLISLTTAIIYLSVENSYFMHHVDRLLVKLSQLETNDRIERLLYDALHVDLCLKLSTKEEIYISQRSKLIEEPLLNNFTCMFCDPNEENCLNKQDEEMLSQLLELGAESACIFQSMFNFLKELLVQLQYAPAVIKFIDSMLKQVSANCMSRGRDMLELYPRKLRSCIILLRIEPEHHTLQTKECTLRMMKQIFVENKNALLILISHFPKWLQFFVTSIANDTQS